MKDLTPKKVKSRVTLLRAIPYRDRMVYLRKIGDDLFMYDLVHENQIYSGNMIFTPRPGQKTLSKNEIANAASLLWAGAVSTINMLLGVELTLEDKARAERMLAATEKVHHV